MEASIRRAEKWENRRMDIREVTLYGVIVHAAESHGQGNCHSNYRRTMKSVPYEDSRAGLRAREETKNILGIFPFRRIDEWLD